MRLWLRREREPSDVQRLVAAARAEAEQAAREDVRALCRLATVVIDEHIEADGRCLECGESFPCARARTAEGLLGSA